MTPVASVIIPSYQHAQYIRDAVDSALAQTVPVEVIVVDDGSTDDTVAQLASYDERVTVIRLPHGGPSVARNAGIDAARGEFVMLLDADDFIMPNKVERQLAEFTPDIGWVLCDTRIEDESKQRMTRASVQYDYGRKQLGGWILPLLDHGNFIPIMAPLIRRSVLGDTIRFSDHDVPEDWAFWRKVASSARLRYVPEVLAVYQKRKNGRSRLPLKARRALPNITMPLRLNLGCGTPGTASWHPMEGFVNLDKGLGWYFEDGLGEFADHSVAGITISHALMYVPLDKWPSVFGEFARVLAEDGVIRITEDVTDDPASSRYKGWRGSEPAVTLTTAELVKAHLARAGLLASDTNERDSVYRDGSLRQAQHGKPPHVFFVEGQKLRGTLFAPHSDDETLFAAFTILRYRPRVVVCYPSTGDYGTTEAREAETRSAMTVLGASVIEQWQGGNIVHAMRDFDARVHPLRVWAPHTKASHPDHIAVARAAREVFGSRVVSYHTYDLNGKVRDGRPVEFEPAWVGQKLRALARYESQHAHPRAHKFFTWDLEEFYAEGAA
jgi:LmbE family N-acetylglucosaminyl deacetylase/GT2 family glycosyltransferase